MKKLILGVLLPLVATMVLVSCGPAKQLEYQQTSTEQEMVYQESEKAEVSLADSLLYRYQNLQEEVTELKATFAELIPEVTAQVTIPMQSLDDLPDGAGYGTTNGRATIEAVRQGDNIVVTGKCDSIARQCILYERQASRYRQTVDSLNAVNTSLNAQINQMTIAAASKDKYYQSLWEESRKPPRFKAGLIVGALAVVLVEALVAFLWKRFGLGTFFKKLFTKK